MSPGTFSEADQIQWGGGVVAEIFRDLHKRNTFAGGGGVVAYIFFSGNSRSKSSKLPHFRQIFEERNNINSLQKKNIYQKFGGVWPPWPPLATPLATQLGRFCIFQFSCLTGRRADPT